MFSIKNLFEKYKTQLGLTVHQEHEGLDKQIKFPEANRPGLSLLGWFSRSAQKRVLVFGKTEIDFLKSLEPSKRKMSLSKVLGQNTPAIFFARGFAIPNDIIELCEFHKISIFRSKLATLNLMSKLTLILVNELGPVITCHGTLVEVFGLGILIQGNSSVGKSEIALGLLERGHSLVSDDAVRIKKLAGSYLEGSSPELTRFLMEIRGIGIINVSHFYGAVAVRLKNQVNLVVKLETWDGSTPINQPQVYQQQCEILEIKLPFHRLFVTPGSDLVSLIETIVLNYRLVEMGYDPNVNAKKNLRKKKSLKIIE